MDPERTWHQPEECWDGKRSQCRGRNREEHVLQVVHDQWKLAQSAMLHADRTDSERAVCLGTVALVFSLFSHDEIKVSTEVLFT